MSELFYDYFEEIEDEELFEENDFLNSEDDENYPTAEEYNRIHKQKYDYF